VRRRAGIDGVIDDRDGLPAQRIVKGCGNAIGNDMRIGEAFSKSEVEIEFHSHHLRHESAAD
jgi:hypothetical protein